MSLAEPPAVLVTTLGAEAPVVAITLVSGELSPLTLSFPGDIVYKRGDCRELDQWEVLRIFAVGLMAQDVAEQICT